MTPAGNIGKMTRQEKEKGQKKLKNVKFSLTQTVKSGKLVAIAKHVAMYVRFAGGDALSEQH